MITARSESSGSICRASDANTVVPGPDSRVSFVVRGSGDGRSVAGPALREAEVQRRHHEQVDERGCNQSAHDHDRHRVLDLLPGDPAGDDQGDEGEARGQRGHHDRGDPLTGTLDDQVGTERHALVVLEVLEMADHHDPVAGHDAENGEEPDLRAQKLVRKRRLLIA